MAKRIVAPGSFSNHTDHSKTVSRSAILQKPDYLRDNIRRVKSKKNSSEGKSMVSHDEVSISSSLKSVKSTQSPRNCVSTRHYEGTSVQSPTNVTSKRHFEETTVQYPRNVTSKRQITSETLVHHKLLLEKIRKSNTENQALMTIGNLLLEKQDEKLIQEKQEQIKMLKRLQEAILIEKERAKTMDKLHPAELQHAQAICENLQQQAMDIDKKKKQMLYSLKHESTSRSGKK